jgi:hypothetical protein
MTPDYLQACRTGFAQMQIGEGYLILECGCAEGTGVVITQGTSATCTVNVGTRVVIGFGGARGRHQIVGEGSPDMGASTVIDPNQTGQFPVLPFVPNLPAAGTYNFRDVFNSSVFGQIVVL